MLQWFKVEIEIFAFAFAFAGEFGHGHGAMVHFVDLIVQEGVRIKARGGLQLNRNTKIGRIAYCKVHPDQNITDT